MEVRFWKSARGEKPVAAYFERLEASGDRRGVAAYRFLLELLAEIGPPLGQPRDRIIDRTSGMYELRPGSHRVAYVRRAETCGYSTPGGSSRASSTNARSARR